jgi:hypothetical protein
VDVGVLVGTLVLDEVVDVHTHFTGHGFGVVHADHDAGRVHVVDHAAALGGDDGAGVDRGHALDAGAHQRLLGRSTGTAWRDMLAPISARFASSCSRNGTSEAATETICAGDTSMYWMVSAGQDRFTLFTRGDQVTGQAAFGVERALAWAMTYLPSSMADR